MSKDDLRFFFSSRPETNNSQSTSNRLLKRSESFVPLLSSAVESSTTTSKSKKTLKKRTKTTTPSKQTSQKRARHSFVSEKIYSSTRVDDVDDDDANDGDFVVDDEATEKDEIQDCGSDSSVLILGSLADEQKMKTQSTSIKEALPTASLLNDERSNKRNEKNQLLSQVPTPHSQKSVLSSGPRRGGTSAADKRVRTDRSAQWVSVKEMCRTMELDGNFTAVDVGKINMGIIQISCLGEKIKILNWKLIDLNVLCKKFEADNPQELFATGVGAYNNESHCHCLFKWVCQQSQHGGIFDSSMVLIEAQSFSREMKALQTVIHTAVIASKPSILVRLNDPQLGVSGMREANFVSPAQIISANSVKTCYAAYFPRVTQTKSQFYDNNPAKKRRAFGHADANDDLDDNLLTSTQYRENKKNSVKYGQMLISVDTIISLLDAKMTPDEKKTFRAKKKDDIYDALWIVLYAIESWLPAVYGRRIRGMGAKNTMYGAMPQRRYRTCDAMFEFAYGIQTPPQNIAELRNVLEEYRYEHVEEENEEDDDGGGFRIC